jgi:hypothetical protein
MAQLQWIGRVGSEGGPLMVADLDSFAEWPGDEGDFDHDPLDKKPAAVIPFNDKKAVFWEPSSPGTISVGASPDRSEIVLLHAIVDDDADTVAFKKQLEAPCQESACGQLKMESDVAVVSWTPVSAEEIADETFDGSLEEGVRDAIKSKKIVELDGNIGGIGIAFGVKPGKFEVSAGTHKTAAATFRWCRLTRKS